MRKLAVAAILLLGPSLPGYAQDAAAPTSAVSQTAAPPPSLPRPSIVPNSAESASPPAAAEPAPRPRRQARRHWRHYASYRTAYWEPFPVFWPHLYHNHIRWNRIPWFSF
jgi:hypothetical protein